MEGIDAFPLAWPDGWKRNSNRGRSKFKTSFARARDDLFRELRLMGVVNNWSNPNNIILSTNIPLRKDGIPYAGQANPKDPGVAIYFKYKGKNMVFACDTYLDVTDNLAAVCKTIEAIRGIQRWGASDMMERAFTGFTALPPPQSRAPWWQTLGFMQKPNKFDDVKNSYRQLSMKYHPDRGGDGKMMTVINQAYAEAEKELCR